MKITEIEKYRSQILLIICVVMYCFSLFLGSIFDGARKASVPGYDLFLFGWIGIFYGTPAWYANPLLFISFALSGKSPIVSMSLALYGFLIAATLLSAHQMVLDEGGSPVFVRLEIGYYIWLACFPVALFASYLRPLRAN